jgi:hypothetical protein
MASSSPLLLQVPLVGKALEDLQIDLSCTHPPEMIFDQSLIYFDLPVCTATQVGLILFYQLNACNLKK